MNTVGICRGFGLFLGVIIIAGVVAVVSKYSSPRKVTATPPSWSRQIENMGKSRPIDQEEARRNYVRRVQQSGAVRVVK